MTDKNTNAALEAAKAKYPVGSRVRYAPTNGFPDEGVVTRHTTDYDGDVEVWVLWDSDKQELHFHTSEAEFYPIPAATEQAQSNPNRHKHADCIVAWANGAEIEVKPRGGDWISCPAPYWYDGQEYRIKPSKPADIVVDRFVELNPCLDNAYNKPNVRYTFDGETKALKAVELLDSN